MSVKEHCCESMGGGPFRENLRGVVPHSLADSLCVNVSHISRISISSFPDTTQPTDKMRE